MSHSSTVKSSPMSSAYQRGQTLDDTSSSCSSAPPAAASDHIDVNQSVRSCFFNWKFSAHLAVRLERLPKEKLELETERDTKLAETTDEINKSQAFAALFLSVAVAGTAAVFLVHLMPVVWMVAWGVGYVAAAGNAAKSHELRNDRTALAAHYNEALSKFPLEQDRLRRILSRGKRTYVQEVLESLRMPPPYNGPVQSGAPR